MVNYNLILASSSPRRIEMMKEFGIEPRIIKPEIDETIEINMDMREAVMFLSLKKALFVEDLIKDEEIKKPTIIIAADTLVYDKSIIGKPESKEDAFNILSSLNGKYHYVITGVSLVEPNGFNRRVFFEITKVHFKKYTEDDILKYINTSEPYDKAGGYAIQGAWGKFVEKIEGDLNNVIGFPIKRIMKEISNLNFE